MDNGTWNELATVPLFAGFSPKDVQAVARVAERCVYGAGDEVLGEGDTRDGIFVITEGSVRVYRTSPDGDEVTVTLLPAGDVFGLPFLSPAVHSRSAVQAIEEGTVAYHIPRHAAQAFIASHPQFALRVVDVLGRRFAAMCDRVEDLALYDVRTRLARELVREVEERNDPAVDMSHEDLATLIGTSRSEVARALSYFRNKGVVTSVARRRGFVVTDLEELRLHARLD